MSSNFEAQKIRLKAGVVGFEPKMVLNKLLFIGVVLRTLVQILLKDTLILF